MKIVEPSRILEVRREYEVAIVGGGVAGLAAAIAAARAGRKVCIIEREFTLGGLATLGLVAIYLPLCDGLGHQLISGISEELLKASLSYGSGEIPAPWKDSKDIPGRKHVRYRAQFDPTSFAYALDGYITQLGIDVMFGTCFSTTVMEGDRISHLILENKEGRFAIAAATVIDASGDGDVCHAAGEETIIYDENRRTGWYYSYSDTAKYQLNLVNEALDKPIPRDSRGYGGIRCEDITEFMLASRKMVFEHRSIHHEKSVVTQIAAIPQLRMTRRLAGCCELKESAEGRLFPDGVGMFGDWRKKGPVYCLPFSALYGRCENLLAVGRCISADDGAWDIVRAIPVCSLTGEVGGTAAALMVSENIKTVRQLPTDLLRKILIQNGNIIRTKL